MSARNRVRIGWPIYALFLLAIGLVYAWHENAGWLVLTLLPAGLIGFVLGRATTTPQQIVAGMRDQTASGVGIAVGIGIAMLIMPRIITAAGPIGPIIVPAGAALISGYMISVATRPDILSALGS